MKLEHALTTLETSGLIRLAQLEPDLEYLFRHALVQEATYESILKADRRMLHRVVAEKLEKMYPDQLDEFAATLAYHFEQAELEAKTVFYLLRAAEQAHKHAAFKEAIPLYQAALEHWPLADLAGRADVLKKLGDCFWVAGDQGRALEILKMSSALFEVLGNLNQCGDIYRMIGRLYWEMGSREQSLENYQQALMLLEQGPETIELARIISAISQMHMLASDFEQAIVHGERALELARRLYAEDVEIHTLNNIGSALLLSGDALRGEALLQASLKRALSLNLSHDVGRGYGNLADGYTALGRYTEARSILEEQKAYIERNRMDFFVGGNTFLLIRVDWLTGNWVTALARQAQLVEFTQSAPGHIQINATIVLGRIYNDIGQASIAYQTLAPVYDQVQASDEIQIILPYCRELARACVALGMDDQVEAIARQCLVIAKHNRFCGDSGMSLLFAAQWFTARRAPEARDCILYLERCIAQIQSPADRAALEEARGLEAYAEEKYIEAIHNFYEAASRWDELARPYDQLRVLNLLTRILYQIGNVQNATETAQQGHSIREFLASQLPTELRTSFFSSTNLDLA